MRIKAGVHLFEASCEKTRDLLSEQLDGELGKVRRFRVERHLTRCSRCGALFASLARTVWSLRRLHADEPPGIDTVVEPVLARISDSDRSPS